MSDMNDNKKTAIITGASAGLGIEFFKAVDSTCDDISEIWVIARRLDRLQSLRSEHGKTVVPISCDLTDDNALVSLQKIMAERKPNVALLINNAGFGRLGDVAELDMLLQKQMIALNCGGLTAVTAMTLKYMQKGSTIINVSSIASFQPNPRMTVYSSTKAFVSSFTDGLRYELKGRGINVFAVCPGPMETEFLPVAGISKGASKQFDTLPRCNATEVAMKSVKYARKGRHSYTNKFLFKLYRVLAKLLPHRITISWGKC